LQKTCLSFCEKYAIQIPPNELLKKAVESKNYEVSLKTKDWFYKLGDITIDFSRPEWKVLAVNDIRMKQKRFMVGDIIRKVDGNDVNENLAECESKIKEKKDLTLTMESAFAHLNLSESNGNLVALNGCHLPFRVISQVIDINSLQHFSLSRLRVLWL